MYIFSTFINLHEETTHDQFLKLRILRAVKRFYIHSNFTSYLIVISSYKSGASVRALDVAARSYLELVLRYVKILLYYVFT